MQDTGTPSSRRLLLIGLDAADRELVEQWSEEGHLPNLARLKSNGVWGSLETTADTVHVSAWPSIFSGVTPDKHGLYHAYVMREGEQAPVRKQIAVVKGESGEILWRKGDYQGLLGKTDSLRPLGRVELAMGDGRVYLADHDAVIGLDLKTGDEVWRTPRPKVPPNKANFSTLMTELCVLAYSDGVVLFLQPEGGISFHSVPGQLLAIDVKARLKVV